jgi:hypothetical protein
MYFAGLPPSKLPDGRKLETLADCRSYILALFELTRLIGGRVLINVILGGYRRPAKNAS